MHFYKKLKVKHEHTLDRMYDLYKFGVARETELEKRLCLAKDELIRISNVCTNEIGGGDKSAFFEEIKQLCTRGLDSINLGAE